jgi:hypothetical protein
MTLINPRLVLLKHFAVILELILLATSFISRSHGAELEPNLAKARRPSDE